MLPLHCDCTWCRDLYCCTIASVLIHWRYGFFSLFSSFSFSFILLAERRRDDASHRIFLSLSLPMHLIFACKNVCVIVVVVVVLFCLFLSSNRSIYARPCGFQLTIPYSTSICFSPIHKLHTFFCSLFVVVVVVFRGLSFSSEKIFILARSDLPSPLTTQPQHSRRLRPQCNLHFQSQLSIASLPFFYVLWFFFFNFVSFVSFHEFVFLVFIISVGCTLRRTRE